MDRDVGAIEVCLTDCILPTRRDCFRSDESGVDLLPTSKRRKLSSLMSVVLIFSQVSGVPPLEEAAEKRWGNDSQWQEYKR